MHLVRDNDVEEFCSSCPSAEDVVALIVYELRLVAELLELSISSEALIVDLLDLIVPHLCLDKVVVVSVAHDNCFSGHLGVKKILNRIWRNFYWPGVWQDLSRYCKTSHTCQMVGKPNKPLDVAPLVPILAFGEPFTRVVIDIAEPLPKTSRYSCIITMLDVY